MLKLHVDKLPANVLTAKDPHHNGNNEWCFYRSSFWHKSGKSDYWVKSKHTHLTEKRLYMFHSLLTNREVIL